MEEPADGRCRRVRQPPAAARDGQAGDASLSQSLRYYTRKLRPKESLQLVLDLDKLQEREGIKIVPLAEWLDRLSAA